MSMSKRILRKFVVISLAVSALWAATGFGADPVPEPFRGHNPDSRFTINYSDVDAILSAMVVELGQSTREVADTDIAPTGTRMTTRVSRSTSREGNRFYFEEFKENEEYRTALHNVRLSLEAIPGRMPLEHFTRTEQLAYWLNLHNITLIDELVRIYPERNLRKELDGKNSILDENVLNVAGVPLSLNDIRYTILVQNFGRNPLVIYGLFQGIIGGPNIRKRAYTGENVYRFLEGNAKEFINSNRGTAFYKSRIFKVSKLYDQMREYFPDFENDLRLHLMKYMDYPERRALMMTTVFKPHIDDWTIADVYGSSRRIGGSFSTSRAAMLDAVVSIQPDGEGGTVVTNFSGAGSNYISRTEPITAISPEQLELLTDLSTRQEAANLVREGRVTVEELGTVETGSKNSGSVTEE